MTSSLELPLNKPSSKAIAIVGGGASAVLLLARLSQDLPQTTNPTEIYLIDENAGIHFGTAYNTTEPLFLLNVPTSNMGAYPDAPADFFIWLHNNADRWQKLHPSFEQRNFESHDFVPRMIYADYLRNLLGDAKQLLANKNYYLQELPTRATNIKALEHSTACIVTTESKLQLIADTVILCTGNSAPNHRDTSNPYAFSPYSDKFLHQDWSTIENIAILGSGLCMVDAIQYLIAKGYRGNIHVFSRQGLTPLAHVAPTTHNAPKAPIFDISGLTTASSIIEALRNRITQNNAQGISWQETINSLRLQSNNLWLAISAQERRKLQKIMPWWNIARHRIAPQAHQQLLDLQQNGKLTLTKGNVQKAEGDGEYFLVHLNNKIIFIRAEKLILCSGYTNNYPQLQSLCDELLSISELQNQIASDQTNLKISKTQNIYALGPTLTGVLFETTAIHEIRQQCTAISSALRQQLNTKSHSI